MSLPEITEDEWARRRQLRLVRMIDLWSRQLLTEKECVTSFIHDCISTDKDRLRPDDFKRLPETIQQHVLSFLNEISVDGYRWRPLMIGHQFTEDELAEIAQRTNAFHKVLQRKS